MITGLGLLLAKLPYWKECERKKRKRRDRRLCLVTLVKVFEIRKGLCVSRWTLHSNAMMRLWPAK